MYTNNNTIVKRKKNKFDRKFGVVPEYIYKPKNVVCIVCGCVYCIIYSKRGRECAVIYPGIHLQVRMKGFGADCIRSSIHSGALTNSYTIPGSNSQLEESQVLPLL